MSNETTTDRDILDRFAQIVAASLRIDVRAVTEDADLTALGAESLDLLEITLEAEEEFNIIFPQKNILQTAQEVLGEGVLVADGKLTEHGRRLVRARVPQLASAVAGDLTIDQLNRLFMGVGTWVQMIARLRDHTPKVCAGCAAPLGHQMAGRLTCKACGAHHDIPLGDDLNRQWVEQYGRDELQLL